MAMESTTLLQAPLDRLPSHLNTVLVQIGRIFQHPVRSDLKTYSRARTQGHEAISKANRQFHEALDEVEMDLLKAKSLLERDLAAIQARRAERENAIRAERLRASSAFEATMAAQFKEQSSDVPVKLEANIDISNAKDVPPPSEQDTARSNGIKSEFLGTRDMMDQDIAAGGSNQMSVTKGQTIQELKELGMSGDIFGDGLASAGFNDISTDVDFDSMFNDSGGNAADSLNFDLDFSGTNTAGNGLFVGGSGLGSAVSTSEMGNLDVTSSEDINSLLPGLESLVNADEDGGMDDFAMLDVPAAEKNNATTSTSGQPLPISASSQNALAVNNTSDENTMNLDTAFDDFIGADNMDLGTSDEVNNIDFDEWFK